MKFHYLTAVALTLCIGPLSAMAQDTNVRFSGTIGAAGGSPVGDGALGAAPTALEDLIGQSFSLDVSYDPNLVDRSPVDNRGVFLGFNSAEVNFGGNTLLASPNSGQISVDNDGGLSPASRGNTDRITFGLANGTTTLANPSGDLSEFTNVSFSLFLEDSSGSRFVDDSLISDPVDLTASSYDIALAGFTFFDGDGAGGTLVVDLQGTSGAPLSAARRAFALNALFPGSVAAVPEPSAGLLLVAVYGAAALRRRRR